MPLFVWLEGGEAERLLGGLIYPSQSPDQAWAIQRRPHDSLGEKADIHVYPIGHFDIYTGEAFETAVANQIKFLKKSFGH